MRTFNYIAFVICCFLAIFIELSFPSCKTKKAPYVLKKPLIEKTVVVQVCDKFQMSYNGLACTVYFSDGSSSAYTTKIDGKVEVKVPMGNVEIEKIVYNFGSYKQNAGQLLASRDFKIATRVPSSPLSNLVVVEATFSSEVKNLFVLVR